MSSNLIPGSFGVEVSIELVEKTARELMHRAAISIPEDFRVGVAEMAAQETNPLSKYVLEEIGLNYEVAAEDQRRCAVTPDFPVITSRQATSVVLKEVSSPWKGP